MKDRGAKMEKSKMEKQKLIRKELEAVRRQEEKLLNRKGFKFIEKQVAPFQEKLEDMIPKKLEETLEKAFIAGFKTVFQSGVGLIERSYNKEEKNLTFDINHYAITKQMNKKNLKKLDQQAKKGMLVNQMMTTVEGGALGVLGIGLPDIPLFIGMMLKNIYEVSLSYGFDYTTAKEKIYILYLICASVTKEGDQRNYSVLLNKVIEDEKQIERGDYALEVIITEAAHQLVNAMLVAKFIQGLPIVGVVGGAYNFAIMKDINKMAQLKYKQRYLKRLLNEMGEPK